MINELVLKDHIIYEDFRLRRLPHIIYESNERCIEIIKSILDCAAGIWPKMPRYNNNGVLDPIEFDDEDKISDSQLWALWSNPYNQKFLAESCGSCMGIFDTDEAMIIDVSVDYYELDKIWKKIYNNYSITLWDIIFSVLDLTKWFILHFYESDTFIFIAEDTMYNSTSRIKRKFFEEGINFVCIHPNGEIKHRAVD
jgi:hypothetical protein